MRDTGDTMRDTRTPLEKQLGAEMREHAEGECLSFEQMWAVAQRGHQAPDYHRVMRHIATCTACRRAYLELRAVMQAQGAWAKFKKTSEIEDPLLMVSPARRGSQTGARLGSPREAGGTSRRGAITERVMGIRLPRGLSPFWAPAIGAPIATIALVLWLGTPRGVPDLPVARSLEIFAVLEHLIASVWEMRTPTTAPLLEERLRIAQPLVESQEMRMPPTAPLSEERLRIAQSLAESQATERLSGETLLSRELLSLRIVPSFIHQVEGVFATLLSDSSDRPRSVIQQSQSSLIQLLEPDILQNAAIADTRPTFRWQPVEHAVGYRLQIQEVRSSAVLSETHLDATQTEYHLPPGIALARGGKYELLIIALREGEEAITLQQRFRVFSEDERSKWEWAQQHENTHPLLSAMVYYYYLDRYKDAQRCLQRAQERYGDDAAIKRWLAFVEQRIPPAQGTPAQAIAAAPSPKAIGQEQNADRLAARGVSAGTPSQSALDEPHPELKPLVEEIRNLLAVSKFQDALSKTDDLLLGASVKGDIVSEAYARRFRAFALQEMRQNMPEQLPEAASAWALALALWQEIGDEAYQVEALLGQAYCLWRVSPEQAQALMEEALRLAKGKVKRPLTLTRVLNNAGVSWGLMGQLEAAEQIWLQALTLTETLAPSSLEVARTLNNLGNVAYARGDLARAEQLYQQALVIQERLATNSLLVAQTLHNLGLVAKDRGDLARAEQLLQQALVIYEKLAPNSPRGVDELNALKTLSWARVDLIELDSPL
jgi:tetratricopeptide (TPR) repeat protein